MNLIRKGYYLEMPHGEQSDPSIKDSIGKLEFPKEKNNISKYLESGIPIAVCCGTVNDVINPKKGIAGCPSMLTDGKYVWPGDLTYYVKNYDLGIDKDFFAQMKENNWEITLDESAIVLDDLYIDGEKLFT